MIGNFSFVIAAPTLKATDKESYKFALQHWKEAVEWAANTFPGMVNIPKPEPPSGTTSVYSEKGEYELEYLRRHPEKRSVRFTTRFREMPRRDEEGNIMVDEETGDFIPLYPDKESFCKALLEGTATGEDIEVERPFVPPIDPTGLH